MTEIKTTDTISTVLVLIVYNKMEQAIMPKSIVPNLGQFDGDQTKFKNWWREI